MPRFDVPALRDQEVLFMTRNLLSPGAVAERTRVSRQAVDQSARLPGGRFLMWAFDRPGRKLSRVAEVYIDCGWRDGPLDPSAWHGSDPGALLAEARQRFAELERAGMLEG